MRDGRGCSEHIAGTDACGQQRLVCVPEGRVRDAKPVVVSQSLRETLRALLKQYVTPSWWRGYLRWSIKRAAIRLIRFVPGKMRQFEPWIHTFNTGPIRLVHGDVSKVGQGARTAVLGAIDLRQVRIFINEVGCDIPVNELLVIEDIQQERDIGGHAANPELCERAPGPAMCCLKVSSSS